jgi:DNA polymerase-3 subunit alpha
VIVYQEQIMQLLQAIAGYTLGNAYIVLKAIGKKNREMMAAEEPRFKEGCLKKGLTKDQADTLWDLIQPFAGYSFNRPHATLYGLLSYQTAWLKTNHPTEYMAAVLTASAGQTEDVAKSVAECGRLSVAVLPADVNRSQIGFTIEQLPEGQLREYRNRQGVRFGLSAVRNVGEGPLSVVFKAREGGFFKSLEDFCERVDRGALNKRVLESLIKCGAMDAMPGSRRQKLAILEQALSAGIESQRAREAGQASMFDLFGGGGSSANGSTSIQALPMPIINETAQDYKEQLAWEKELLGMYVSDHPIARALEDMDTTDVTALGQLGEEHAGKTLTFMGMISQIRRLTTKKGDSMLVAMLEDLESSIELVAFPKSYEKYRELLQEDALLRVTAKVDKSRRDDSLQLMLENASVLEVPTRNAANHTSPPQMLDLPPPQMDLEGQVDAILDHTGGGTMIAPTDDAPHPAEMNSGHASVTNSMENKMDRTDSMNSAASSNSATPVSPPSKPAEMPADSHSISIIRPRVKVGASSNGGGNGNGNGHSNSSNGGGSGYTVVPLPEPESNQALRLFLPRTDDFDADVRLMQTVDRVLRQSSGEDAVFIHMPNAVGTVLLKPRHKVRCDDLLIGALRDVLGNESVVMER